MADFHLDPPHFHRINNVFDLNILTGEHQVKKVAGRSKDYAMSRNFSFLDHKDHITQRFLIEREIDKIKRGSLGLA